MVAYYFLGPLFLHRVLAMEWNQLKIGGIALDRRGLHNIRRGRKLDCGLLEEEVLVDV